MSNYWPWWEGAVALALLTITYTLATDRSFGVSTAWDRVVHWRTERHIEQAEAQFTDEHALTEALAAATPEQIAARPGPSVLSDPTAPGEDREPSEYAETAPPRPAPVVTQAALLVSILLGGWVAAMMSGRFEFRDDMGPRFSELVTANPITMIVVLFAGGILVGFGTRLAGGCTSGHGLSGCGRLRPVSLVATVVFFGTAVVVSFLLWKVI